MNILYVNHTRQLSGAGISLGTLIRHLPMEYSSSFMVPTASTIDGLIGATPDRTVRMKFMPQAMTTTYHAKLPLTKNLWQILKLFPCFVETWRAVRKSRAQVLHLNETCLVGHALSAILLGLPVVIHARTAFSNFFFAKVVLTFLSRRRRVRFVCIDHEVHDSLPQEVQSKAEVVYNPVEMRPVGRDESAAIRARWGVPGQAVLVGQVASLHRQKGVWRILEIAEDVCRSNSDIHFVLVGDTSPERGEGPDLLRAVTERGLLDRVHLVGYEQDVALAYSALDIALCLFGEHLGGVGRAAYEAPLARKPLVATTPDPASSKSVLNGQTGLAFRPGDLNGVKTAILSLARDATQRQFLGESAQNVIADRHDPTKHATKICEIYRQLAGTRDETKNFQFPVI
jgi:glycosyltransferase involved in cell wall biosynthesis